MGCGKKAADLEDAGLRYSLACRDFREELLFRIIGYVLMPEHFHILLWPSELANPSEIMQKLEDRSAKFILKNLRHNREFAWCERI